VVATLGFPQIFVPGIWGLSSYMLILVVSSWLLNAATDIFYRKWSGCVGLAGAIVLAFFIFEQFQILILLIALPLLAVVTLGVPKCSRLHSGCCGDCRYPVPLHQFADPFYGRLFFLGSIFTTTFGWGLSSNLLDALEAASYHYSEARRLLGETQNHQAENRPAC